MSTDFESLQEFFKSETKNPDLAERALGLVKGFSAVADSGRFPFCPVEKLDLKKAAEAISTAIGSSVNKIVVLSASQPFTKPGCMTENANQANLVDGLLVSHWASLRDNLWASLETNLRASLVVSIQANRGASLVASLVASHWASLRVRLVASLRASLRASFVSNLGDGLMTSLTYFLIFACTDDTITVKRLTPLMELLLQGAIPMGEKADEHGAWIVVVA